MCGNESQPLFAPITLGWQLPLAGFSINGGFGPDALIDAQ